MVNSTKAETSAINQFKPAHTYAAPYHESEASISLHVIVSHIQHIAVLRLADKTPHKLSERLVQRVASEDL